MNRRDLIGGAVASVVAAPAKAKDAETARFRDALERIALLDEVDGHELKLRHAFEAVAIASNVLGKHPSQIAVDREARQRAEKDSR